VLRDNGVINSNQRYSYKYDYGRNELWTYHGFDITVDSNTTYTWSLDAYISPDADVAATGRTFIADGEKGFVSTFTYDNTKKGVWQHFEYTGKPTSTVARLLLYPSTSSLTIPATKGFVQYSNVEFRKKDTATNLFPQPADNDGFAIKENGILTTEAYANSMYQYDYSQKQAATWHGFDVEVDPNATYTWSLDAYISPDADIAQTGSTFIANGEKGFPAQFRYNNAEKGTWQHFEFTGKPSLDIARILLYPTLTELPATRGYILYKNIDFRKVGTAYNLFPQPTTNEGFNVRENGVFTSKIYNTYSYDYAQNLPWTWHGFDIAVDPNTTYTWSFDAFISPEANIPRTGTTPIAQGEKGFPASVVYDNTKKGTWQHFEFTGKPVSNIARLLLYPSNFSTPATTGYILYRNVELKKEGEEWNRFVDISSGLKFKYDENGRLVEVKTNNSKVPIIRCKYDANGNIIGREVILQ
jgi:hypothetical protein